MYNRYIPQNDGTFLRKRIQDPSPPPPPPPERQPLPEAPCEPQEPPKNNPPSPQRSVSPDLGSFWGNLLPKGFDTGDLIVVLLLLLMAADCQEDQNTALLTLALYLFL